MHFFEGLGLGLSTALLIGPVFFTLLRAALERGFKGGAMIALGIIASDVVAMLLCLSGSAVALREPVSERWLALLAGILLLCLGVFYLRKEPHNEQEEAALGKRHAAGLFATGFAVNLVNPFVFAVWAGIVLHATSAHGAGGDRALFLFAVLLGIFSSDLVKAGLAPRLRPLLAPTALRRLYRAMGCIMLAFGVWLLWHGWSHPS